MPDRPPAGPLRRRGETVAVTGANGFVAAHCVRRLLEAGYAVRACVRDPAAPAKTAFLRDLAARAGAGGRLAFFRGDLGEPGSYDAALEGADAVIHAAAVVLLSGSKDPENEIVAPAVEGTRNVLESAKRSSTLRRFIQLSSVAAVYDMRRPPGHVFTEADVNDFSTVANGDAYGCGKSEAEKLVWEAARGGGLGFDVVALNPSVVIGPVLAKAHTKASPIFVRQMLYGNPFMDFPLCLVDVRDVAEAHLLALEAAEASGERFILSGTPQCMYASDLAPTMRALFPTFPCPVRASPPPRLRAVIKLALRVPLLRGLLAGDFGRLYFLRDGCGYDNAKSREVLGLQYTPLDESVRATVESMLGVGQVKPKL